MNGETSKDLCGNLSIQHPRIVCRAYLLTSTGIGIMFAEDPQTGTKMVYEVLNTSTSSGQLMKGDVLETVGDL